MGDIRKYTIRTDGGAMLCQTWLRMFMDSSRYNVGKLRLSGHLTTGGEICGTKGFVLDTLARYTSGDYLEY